ncbi:MAG TPA: alpha-L-rhamnosidase C-terminal domain-containing protein [Solirubrobacteraceae bacterium]|nr:alpha-L-rhamnosidase C-terminal domain-containing protein [Solirubrobacteraceae bacterium]
MRVSVGTRRRTILALAVLSSLLLAAAAAHAATTGNPTTLSSQPIAANAGWTQYVEAPSSPVVQPVRAVSTTGDVSNPDALLQGHSGSTTLTYPQGGTAPMLVLDYGKEIGGFVKFTVAGVSQPTELESAYSEVLANLSASGDGGPGVGLAGSGSLRRADNFAVTGPGPVTSSNLQGGERYELVTLGSPGVLTLTSASIQFTPFRGTPNTYRGYFLSSSDLLNRIWYAGTYTANLDQVIPGTPGIAPGTTIEQPVIVDGAKRDRAVWVGDLNVTDLTLLDGFGQTGASYDRGSLTLLGDHPATAASLFAPTLGTQSSPGPMPGFCPGESNGYCAFYSATYSMEFVLDMYDYYLYSADLAFVQQEWPLVQRELAWESEQLDSSGLFATNEADGADWDVDIHGGDYAAPSVLHYQSLLDGAALADAVGDSASARAYRGEAAAERAAINDTLWDGKLGAYDASTAERGFLVQDANVWAVLAGVASPARSKLILANLAKGLTTSYGMFNVPTSASSDYRQIVSPYIGSYTLWADYQAGRPDLGLSLMETEWGWMVDHDPGGTDWEKLETGGTLSSADSAAHGWGTGATSALSQYVLGIQPAEPGFATWRVQPEPYGLNWAQGTVPTPYGPIASRWQVGTSSSSFKLTVAAPSGTSGTLAVPLLGAPRVIAEDGRVVWTGSAPVSGTHASTDGRYVYFSDVTGTHTWAW